MDATSAGHKELSFRDSYALLFAFTLAVFIPAIFGLGTQAYYSYTPGYLAFMTAPPLLAMIALIFMHQPSVTPVRTLGKALLFGVVSMIGGGALFLTSSFFLAFLGPAFESHTFDPLQVGIAIIMVGYMLPLVLAVIARVRKPSAVALMETLILLAAIAAFAWIAWVILTQQGTLSDVLRKDQVSYLVGGLLWYIPAYSLVGSVIRSLGVL
ncbi:MAG: hypothetical protein CVT66_04365 [Actinobacteria bacterium HGW-Actinobacteria-6]|nr:MAG: hypothetical protein CVT66_04365 [Actinobacteria bacterium HGW-Actinobacteria-6]